MKKMVYKKKKKKEVLENNSYKGIEYYIVSMGTFPCAYLNLPNKDSAVFHIVDNFCHGGVTYSEPYLDLGYDKVFGNFVGWDYAHYGDYMGGYPEIYPDLSFVKFKKWTTEEMIEEVHKVIDAICNYKEELDPKEKVQEAIENLAEDLKNRASVIACDTTDIEEITISAKIRYNEIQSWEITKKYAAKNDNGEYFSLNKEE